MFNQLAEVFLNSHSESDAVNLIRSFRCAGFYNLAIFVGEFLEKQFPHSVDIKDEHAISAYYTTNYIKSFDIFERALSMKGLSEKTSKSLLFNQHFSINHVCDRYTYYNENKISEIINRKQKTFPLITLTITTCKRFDLFEKTMNSFINCCMDIDKIDHWICIDDNSSDEDKTKMTKLYPFFNFYFKDRKHKGHPQSMNILRTMIKTPYFFHMEDDWKFFSQRRFLSEALEVLGYDSTIKQCLINKNYSETERDISVKGGEFCSTNNGTRFYIHEFANTPESIAKWTQKHGADGNNSSYWPHFSFRPSLIKTSILFEVGEFNENVSHFEMEYSYRYTNKGYRSAFFEGINCLHIGRLTSERHNKTIPNAYELNGEAQLYGKEELANIKEIKTYVINLDRRPDRLQKFTSNIPDDFQYERFPAVDGSNLKSTAQLQRIFDGNNYNMRKGMVGCAMSHIKLYIELINSEHEFFCILEDDIDFVPNFKYKLSHLHKQIIHDPWDIVFIGHHLYSQYISKNSHDKEKLPTAEKWDTQTSLMRSIGGTGGYLISKKGAINILEFLNKNGIINGIDTCIQKAADLLNIYYSEPHLIYSDCWNTNNTVDTDIQWDFDSLTVPLDQRFNDEVLFYGGIIPLPHDVEKATEIVSDINQTNVYCYMHNKDNMENVQKNSVHPSYTLEDKILIIVPKGNPERYFDRLKKNNIWSIEDALQTK